MGQHKHNPIAIAAAKGEIPPRPEEMSKREREAMLLAVIKEKTGISALEREMAKTGIIKPFG
jgi:hypothetical protein